MARKHADDIETLARKPPIAAPVTLYKNATQTVFGEGPQTARIMLVGEQPGDKEDLAGKPFVGPAARCSTARWKRPASTPQGLRHQCGQAFQVRAARKNPPAPEAEHAGDQGLPAMVRTGTGHDQTRSGGGHGRYRGAKRAGENTPINKNRGRLINLDEGIQSAGDGASVLSVAIARCRCQGTGISALCRGPEDRGRPAAKIGARGLKFR